MFYRFWWWIFIKDVNGEDPLSYCFKSISKEKKGIVKIDTSTGKIKLLNNDKVTFKEIERTVELNNCDPMNIKFYQMIPLKLVILLKKELNFNSLEKRLNIPYLENEQIPEQIDVSKYITYKIIHFGI